MEKKVLLKELVDTGTNLRKQIISKVRVSDQGAYPIGEIWDANTTINTIVDGASIAFDTLKEVEEKLEEHDAQIAAEIARAKAAEQAEQNRATAAENNLQQTKADKANTYTKSEVYNKTEMNTMIGEMKIPDTYAIYSYQAFNADGSIAYGTGKAQLTGVISGDYTQINIIEATDEQFIGQKYYMPTNATADGITLNQLYDADKQPVGIAVKITLYSDTTYKSCSVKEYIDYMVSHYASGGTVGPSTVDSASIIDGSVQLEDLSDEVRDKLKVTVDEADENATIGG